MRLPSLYKCWVQLRCHMQRILEIGGPECLYGTMELDRGCGNRVGGNPPSGVSQMCERCIVNVALDTDMDLQKVPNRLHDKLRIWDLLRIPADGNIVWALQDLIVRMVSREYHQQYQNMNLEVELLSRQWQAVEVQMLKTQLADALLEIEELKAGHDRWQKYWEDSQLYIF